MNTGSGWTENTLHTFSTVGDGGYTLWAGVALDGSGNVYGGTFSGGSGNGGTLFDLSAGNWNFSLLFSFTGESLGLSGSMIMDHSGNLYGVTAGGGANGDGTVFELTPVSGGWSYTDLHDFSGSDGAHPYGSLTLDSSGNLYGTAQDGGTNNAGVVFEITP